MSSGKILPGLPVVVDNWEPVKKSEQFRKYVHFLTHFHTDQTKGLTSTWTQNIYTSEINANLVVKILKVDKSFLKTLSVGSKYRLTLPPKIGEKENYTIQVTAIDAHHIKGSLMFLFQGEFGNVLYTGDFRFCDTILKNPYLKQLSDDENLDVLYVDNTYEEVGNEFPTREKSVNMAIKVVEQHKYHRIIFGCQTIGKEDALVQVAQTLKSKVYVPENIYKIYQILGLPDVFTTDQNSSMLWFSELKQISYNDLKERNKEHPTIAIPLTASGSLQKMNKQREADFIHTVPYSNHSSASELAKFLSFVKPKRIERLVPSNETDRKSVINDYLTRMRLPSSSDDESESSSEPEEFRSPVKKKKLMSSPTCQDSPFESNAVDMTNTLTKAEKVIQLIHTDLNKHGDDVIFSENFIERLLSLARLYQPLTGINLADNLLS